MLGRIDHIGVATDDLDGALALYEQTLGMPLAHVELLRPLAPDTPVGKYLAEKGPGLHHVAYAVADIDRTLGELKGAGIELIDSEPREGIRDSRVAFVHPRSTGGVLTEIVQPAEVH
jgi:methylmalonyl-CoA/ethylmalonyl-CoA epimerase